jgi:tricorn protease-like protein
MSSPKKAIFRATSDGEKIVFNNPSDVKLFLQAHKDKRLVVTIESEADLSEKQRMYAYYHTAVLDSAVTGYTRAGYECVDKVVADYLLKANHAKDFVYNKIKNTYEPYLIDKKDMDRDRLFKYLSDCVFHIEVDLGIIVPDSKEHLEKRSLRNSRWK